MTQADPEEVERTRYEIRRTEVRLQGLQSRIQVSVLPKIATNAIFAADFLCWQKSDKYSILSYF